MVWGQVEGTQGSWPGVPVGLLMAAMETRGSIHGPVKVPITLEKQKLQNSP